MLALAAVGRQAFRQTLRPSAPVANQARVLILPSHTQLPADFPVSPQLRSFAAAAGDGEITVELTVPFETHKCEPPSTTVTTTKSEFIRPALYS